MSIKANDIKFSYKIQPILDNIKMEFGKGHLYGILGPNGCGKTTFLNILAGILRQKHGEIVIENKKIEEYSNKDLAKTLAYVQQKGADLDFDFTVSELITMGRYAYIDRFSGESKEDQAIVETILKDLQIYSLKDRLFSELSGGEQQKVMIARALAQKGKILLLDEPTNHLDINFKLEFMELFKNLVKQGIIVILVLHDLNLAAQFCDKIIFLKKGKVEAFGTIAETITKENIKEVYNTEVVVGKNQITQSIFVIPLRNKAHFIETNLENVDMNKLILKIHVIAGAGIATPLLIELQRYQVSIGVVNVLDDDHITAENLGYDLISEAPFSPISKQSENLLKRSLKDVHLVILTNIPYGNANIKNLEIINMYVGTIMILEETPIEDRDFTDGKATELYHKLCNKSNSTVFHSLQDMLPKIIELGKMIHQGDK
jgi:cobalamin transport system ATP-binding protein